MPTAPAAGRDPAAGGWLLSRTADLLLIANLAWPIVFLGICLNRRYLKMDLELFLASAIGTPHRWLTLPLIANDRARLPVQ